MASSLNPALAASPRRRLPGWLATAWRYGLSTSGPVATSGAHFLASLLFVRNLVKGERQRRPFAGLRTIRRLGSRLQEGERRRRRLFLVLVFSLSLFPCAQRGFLLVAQRPDTIRGHDHQSGLLLFLRSRIDSPGCGDGQQEHPDQGQHS